MTTLVGSWAKRRQKQIQTYMGSASTLYIYIYIFQVYMI